MIKHKLIIAVTGASGAIYAKVLFDKLVEVSDQVNDIGVVFSENARKVWEFELDNNEYKNLPFKIYESNDFYAPFASGSSGYSAMVVCPCSMGTLGKISSGIANDLISRAADVILKERKKLILVVRETPLNLIHINNMKTITEAGGIICPANPSFYSKPVSKEEIVSTVIERVLQLLEIHINSFKWGEK